MSKIYRLVCSKTQDALANSEGKRFSTRQASQRLPDEADGLQPWNQETATPQLRRLPALLALATSGFLTLNSLPAWAACTPNNPAAGATVTCSGDPNNLDPSFSSAANNLTVNLNVGSTLGVLPGLQGYALTLTGNGVTLNNAGTIDPASQGQSGYKSTGTVIGNASSSVVTVNNTGSMAGYRSLLGVEVTNLNGLALVVQNGTAGVSNLTNSGTIGNSEVLGVQVPASDSLVAAVIGGGRVNFVNSSTGVINGRVGLEASSTPGAGNTFVNAGRINGSVSMGANSTNTFTAVTGSVISADGSLDASQVSLLGSSLRFASTGTVDGGAGGNNTLRLQNSATGTGSGTAAAGNIDNGVYVNFQHLRLNSGTWTLNGAQSFQDATLSDGVALLGNAASLGVGAVTVNGGAIQADSAALSLLNNFSLQSDLTVQGTQALTISGVISGAGGLTKNDSGTLTLTGLNTYSGGTVLNKGALILGDAGAIGSGALRVNGASASLDTTGSMSLGNSINLVSGAALSLTGGNNLSLTGVVSGAGGLVKDGITTLTLRGANTFSGGTTINDGVLALGAGGSLTPTGAVHVAGASAEFDISAAAGNQTIGALSSVAGSRIHLGSNILSFGDASNQFFEGIIGGAGGVVKQGVGVEKLIGSNTYTGSTSIAAGTLLGGAMNAFSAASAISVSAGGTLDLGGYSQTVGSLAGAGSVSNSGTSDAVLISGGDNTSTTFSGAITDGGTHITALIKSGTGTLTLAGANAYTGGTLVLEGTLVGDATSLSGSINNAAIVEFNQAGAGLYGGTMSGAGVLVKAGGGALQLDGNSSAFTGTSNVKAGSLTVNSQLGGVVNVASGGTLGGRGQVGTTTVASGGTLAPGVLGSALTVNGPLTMDQGSVLAIGIGTPGPKGVAGLGTSANVIGDLALNGTTVNVADAGGMGIGLYRLFDYSGTLSLSNGGLALGAIPANAALTIQHLTANKQINLLSSMGLTLNLWNADGRASNTQAGGGSGTWSNNSVVWTDAAGTVTSAMQPQPGFAIFAGNAGQVTLSASAGAVQATGLQFASNGYSLNGDTLTLVANNANPAPVEVRVGDGSVASKAYVASIGNVIAGVDGLNKTGEGTLVLSGINTYAGGTTLSAGTVSISSDANLGAGAGNLNFNGGTLQSTADITSSRNVVMAGNATVDTQSASTIAMTGRLSGPGSLTKLGNGTLALNRANSYQGGTNVQAGRLTVNATGALGSGAVTVSGSESMLGFATIDATPVSAQALTIRNENGGSTSFLGHASAGTAMLINGTQGATTFADQATADAATIVNNAGGNVDIRALTSTGISVGSLSGAGTVLLGNKSLTLGGLNQNDVIAGIIGGVGGSLVKTGTGTLTLDGANTYTGSTQVQSGKLLVGSASGSSAALLGAVSIANGATLAGHGTVGSTSIASGGTLAPGNGSGVGVLTVNGDLTMNAGSVYRIEANPTTANSTRVAVTGAANLLGGSVVHVGPDSTYTTGLNYTILSAAGGVKGVFDQARSSYAYLTPKLEYTPTAVTLELAKRQVPVNPDVPSGPDVPSRDIQFNDLAITGNQRSVARALQSLPQNSDLYKRILTLGEGAPPGAFDNLSGEAHAGASGVLQSSSIAAQAVPLSHLRHGLSAGMMPGAATADAGFSDAPIAKSVLPSSAALPAWAEVVGSWQTQDASDTAAKSTQRTGGLFIGADHAIGNGWRVGAAVGYTDSTIRTNDRNSKVDVSSYSATLYGGRAFDAGAGKLNLLMGGAYTWHDLSTTRGINAAGLNERVSADYGASTTQLFTELGYAMPFGDSTIEPFAGVAWSDSRTRGFSESGGSAALNGKSKSDTQSTTTLGLRAQTPFTLASTSGTVRGSLGWRHAFGSVTSESTLAFNGGQAFTVTGAPIARDAALLELGAEFAISRNAVLGLGYTGQLSKDSRESAATVNARWRF